MKRFIYYLLFITSISIIDAQPETQWKRIFPQIIKNVNITILEANDNGFIFIGTLNYNTDSAKACITKLDSKGNTKWERIFGKKGSEYIGNHIEKTNDGGYLAVIDVNPITSGNEFLLIKLNSSGIILWEKTLNNAPFKETADGGFIFLGINFVFKTDSKGNILWRANIGGQALIETNDGSFLIAGVTYGKIDKDGNILWKKNFPVSLAATGVCKTFDNCFVIVGEWFIQQHAQGGAMLKIDNSGNVLWTTYASNGIGGDVKQTPDGGYVITGTNWFILKLDPMGKILWTLNVSNFYGCSMQLTTDGGCIIIDQSGTVVKYKPFNKPFISFINPLGGEVWNTGSNEIITWYPFNKSSIVNIDLSTNGGSSWVQIRNHVVNDGKIRDWIVPNTPSIQCKLRINDVNSNISGFSDRFFTILPPSIQITYPADGEIWIIGSNPVLQWKSTALSKFVNIELSTNGGSSWTVIRNCTADDGAIKDWIVPNTPSSQCKLRITDISGSPSATSSGFFTISKPFIAVIFPTEGSIIEAVENPRIEWKSYNISTSYINIDLSTDGGTSWKEIRNHVKNDGYIRDWIVPNYLSAQCKIRMTDSTGTILGISKGYFTISPRRFGITSPKGGEIWKVGSNQIIQWYTTINISGYVKIDLSTDGGTSWQTIRNCTVDDGKVRDWIVPNTPSTQCKIRISDTTGTSSAVSNGYFTITKSLGKSNEYIASEELPKDFALDQNFPNPFNPETMISYQVPDLGEGNVLVQIKVYDVIGREITTLVNEVLSPGFYRVNFDGSNLTSGVYIYRLTAGSFNSIKKMVLTK